MIIDTHCHYNLDPLFEDWNTHWTAAQARGVEKSIIVGTNLETSQRALELAQLDDGLSAAIGIHPNEYDQPPSEPLHLEIESLTHLSTFPKVVAVGETGLDYFRLPTDSAERQAIQQRQQAAFVGHIQLAEKIGKPLIIHVRDTAEATQSTSNAYYDVLALLKRHHSGSRPFVLHCVSGPQDYIKQSLELGAYLGIAGNVTYKSAEAIREIVRRAPKDRLLTETDAPFLPPQPFRGQPCQPHMIADTLNYLITELNLDPDQLVENALSLF